MLDLAAREGYGARILAETAASVTALDVDLAVIQEAARKHKAAKLQFLAGSPLDMPFAPGQNFDAIICFDAIEDSTNTGRLFAEIKSRLTAGGVLLCSAPRTGSRDNLFRAKTFTPEDLRNLLASSFSNVQLLNQALAASSVIQPETASSNGAFQPHGEPDYVLAAASDSKLPAFAASTCADSVLTILRQKEKSLRELVDVRAFQDETIKRQQRQLADQKRSLASLEEASAWHTSQIHSLSKTKAYLENEIDQLRQAAKSDRQALDWRASQLRSLEGTITAKDEGLEWRAKQVEDLERSYTEALDDHQKNIERLVQIERQLSQQIAHLSGELESIHASSGWKFVLRVRSIKARLLKLVGK